jgi:hypothetical protein
MTDANGLPPKVYRKMLSSIYFQTKKDAQLIRNNWANQGNPIVQKENRYFSPRTKGNLLTQEYIKKMADKPQRPHIRRIPIQGHLSSGPKVTYEEKKIEGIKFHPKLRKNQSSLSAPKIDNHHKHLSQSGSFKNFYLDNFNSIKETQNDLDMKHAVSENNLIINIYYIFYKYRRDLSINQEMIIL